MIGRAVAVGVPFAWFTAGAACGQAKLLQARLEEHDVSYVMAIRRSGTLATAGDGQRAGALSPARRRAFRAADLGRRRVLSSRLRHDWYPIRTAPRASQQWPS